MNSQLSEEYLQHKQNQYLKGQANFEKAVTTAVNSMIWGEPNSTISMSDSQLDVTGSCQVIIDFWELPDPFVKTMRASGGVSLKRGLGIK